jgi:hypothetical protein
MPPKLRPGHDAASRQANLLMAFIKGTPAAKTQRVVASIKARGLEGFVPSTVLGGRASKKKSKATPIVAQVKSLTQRPSPSLPHYNLLCVVSDARQGATEGALRSLAHHRAT